MLEEVIQLEGPHTIAAFILETGHRHQRHPGAARRLHAGRARAVHEARHPDDLRRGDGRLRPHRRVVRGRSLERRARHDHDGEGADERLRAARRRRHAARDRRHFKDKVFYGGLTYNSHPLACAAALATIEVYEEDNLIENARRMGAVMTAAARRSARASIRRSAPRARSACSGSSSWCATRRRRSRWRRSTARRTRWRRSASSSGEEGLYTFVRWNTFFTNPPLCITEAQLREAFAIIDRGLEITDRAVKSKKLELEVRS